MSVQASAAVAAFSGDVDEGRTQDRHNGNARTNRAFIKSGKAETALWILAGASFAALLLLACFYADAFGPARLGYACIAIAGLVACIVMPSVMGEDQNIPYRLLTGVGLLSVGADQLSKWLAVCFLKGKATIPVIPGLFHFTYVENPGAAFGLLRGHTSLFIFMALLTVMIIAVYFRLTGDEERLVQVALVLILAGAVGNLIDRIFLTYVVDFFDVHWHTFKWPVFNVADTIIDVGVGLIVIDVVRDLLWGQSGQEG